MTGDAASGASKMLPLVLVALFTLPFAKAQSQDQPESLVFTHVTVIDATGASPRPDMTVMITGNRIRAITKTAVSIPKEAQVIDATGKFLIPGLWDMHVHWYGPDKAYKADHPQHRGADFDLT